MASRARGEGAGHGRLPTRSRASLPPEHLVLAFVIFRNPAFFYLIPCDNLFTFSRAKTKQLLFYRNTRV